MTGSPSKYAARCRTGEFSTVQARCDPKTLNIHSAQGFVLSGPKFLRNEYAHKMLAMVVPFGAVQDARRDWAF